MSENEIKPVAWQYKNGKRWETVSENTYTVYCVGRERRSLYDQVTIDRLTAERDALRTESMRYRELIEYALAQHNGRHADHGNHWAAKAMNELAAIDGARAREGQG